jgi:hypothetical protein
MDNDGGLYDVEEFDDDSGQQERIPPPPVRKRLDTAPVYADTGASGYENHNIYDEKFESVPPYPKPDFNKISLKAYDLGAYIASALVDIPPQTVSGGAKRRDDASSTEEEIETLESEDNEYEDIPEIGEDEAVDELTFPVETLEELDAALVEDVPPSESTPDTDTRRSRHDIEWLKLAGEASTLEPENICAELSGEPEKPNPAAPPEKKVQKESGIELSSDILENDPFGRTVFTNNVTTVSKNPPINILTTKEPAYGEFIPAAVEEAEPEKTPPMTPSEDSGSSYAGKPADLSTVKSADSIYDVEEFEEADDDTGITPAISYSPASAMEEYTFESPHKGTDLNEIARQIEFAPMPEPAGVQDDDFDLDVSSPANELFAGGGGRSGNGNTADDANNNHPGPDTNGGEKSVIKNRGGVDYIDSAALREASVDTKGVDPVMKNLVDSVLKTPSKPPQKAQPNAAKISSKKTGQKPPSPA